MARGRRTVAAALRQMGLHDRPDFSGYHLVLNRAAWSPRRVARRMIVCLRRWLPGIALTVVGDTAYSVIELGLACQPLLLMPPHRKKTVTKKSHNVSNAMI